MFHKGLCKITYLQHVQAWVDSAHVNQLLSHTCKSPQSDYGGTEFHTYMCTSLFFPCLSTGTEPYNVTITLLHLQSSTMGQKLPAACPSKADTHSQTLSSPVRFKKCLVKLVFVYLITSQGKYGDRKEKTPLSQFLLTPVKCLSVCAGVNHRVQTSCVQGLHGALPLNLQSWKLCFAR